MNEQKIQMVFFDAAGTLFDVRGSVGEIYARFAAQYGKHVAAEELQSEFVRHFPQQPPMAFARTLTHPERLQAEQNWWRTLVCDVFAGFGEFPHFEDYFVEVFEFFRRAEAWMVFTDVEPTLVALKARGLRLGVISNFDARLYDVLDTLQLRTYFDSVHISTEVGAAKPDPAIFQAALTAQALHPTQALHIGDSLSADVQGARAAGLSALWL
ncbi:MAG TPA: HAD-IA family hydrolase, partial [Blastocatellia bacterium]|nr:HAD-IA family hydrolase [Blastocatellia bacterium]